jgi:N-glycosylase/DNA lyase
MGDFGVLLAEVGLLRDSEVGLLVRRRIGEFEEVGRKPVREVFRELCFCIMTANCAAGKCWSVQLEIGEGFLTLSERALERRLRACGYRFPNRAEYIVGARGKISGLEDALASLRGEGLRDWLVKNIRGLGMKEASHFLRNIGYKDYAIIDFHIVDLLVNRCLIERPKTLSKKKYLEIEIILARLAEKLGLNLAELDLYLWYLETGEVLK